jgi:hypothetical protein
MPFTTTLDAHQPGQAPIVGDGPVPVPVWQRLVGTQYPQVRLLATQSVHAVVDAHGSLTKAKVLPHTGLHLPDSPAVPTADTE